jgi:hypothetical protein
MRACWVYYPRRVTVPASASVFTGKPAPGTAAAIARGILSEPYPLAQVNAARTLATQALWVCSCRSASE